MLINLKFVSLKGEQMSLAYISVEYLRKNPHKSHMTSSWWCFCFNAKLKEFLIVCVVLQKVHTALLCLYQSKLTLFFLSFGKGASLLLPIHPNF